MGTLRLMDARQLYQRLRQLGDEAVPLIGAGMAQECGVPGSRDLADRLLQAAGQDPKGEDLFVVANRLEISMGGSSVREHAAEIIRSASIVVSPAMRAITSVPGRVIATTNYDAAIEFAAKVHGLTPVTLTVDEIGRITAGPAAGELLVVHLHGTIDRPDSIVLTDSAYEAAGDDEALQLLVRHWAVSRTFVFLGHRLGEQEAHLRRDIRRVVELLGRGDHILIRPAGTSADLADFKSKTGVEVAEVASPPGTDRFRFVLIAARALGAPPHNPAANPLTTVPASWVAGDYLPLPLAPAADVATEEQRAVWLYSGSLRNTELFADHLDDRSRLVFIGAPGTGKTQTLFHLAKRPSRFQAIYIPLGNVLLPEWDVDASQVLVTWANSGLALDDGIQRLEVAALADGMFAFYLDGLDERADGRRGDIIGLVNRMADLYPQHRFVITSRPVPELVSEAPELVSKALEGFEAYAPIPTRRWLLDYAEHQGVAVGQLDALADRAAGLDQLLTFPLFAAAAVAAIVHADEVPDSTLPTSALELLLDLASTGLDAEQPKPAGLLEDREHVEAWLNRLALVMVSADAVTVDRDLPALAPLAGPMTGKASVDWLCVRALISENGQSVGFHVRPIRDARAARAIANHPDGEKLLARLAFFDLDGERWVRPSWRYPIDLLLTDDPARWTPIVKPVDPLAAARATPADAQPADRHGAIRTICDWYRAHRIFLPRTNEGQLFDDLDAISRLAADPLSADLVEQLTAELTSPERTSRANAMAVLTTARDQALRPHLPDLITDPDPVVRRQAAQAVADLQLADCSNALVDQALVDDDDLARQSLVSNAVAAAADDDLAGLLPRVPARLAGVARLALERRDQPWDRDAHLAYLASRTDADGRWLEDLAAEKDPPWSADQIQTFARLWFRSPGAYPSAAVRNLLDAHPTAALLGALAGATQPGQLLPVLYLTDRLSDDQLATLETQASGPAVTDFFADVRRWGTKPNVATDTSTLPPANPASGPGADTLIRQGELDQLLDSGFNHADLSRLTDGDRSALAALLETRWRDADGLSPIQRIREDEPGTYSYDGYDRVLASLGIGLRIPLLEGEWALAATRSVDDESSALADTYQRTWDPNIVDHFTRSDNVTLSRLLSCIPAPWSTALAEAISQRCFASGDEDIQNRCAQRLAAGHVQLLRDRAGTHAADVALARLGDPPAQQRLLVAWRHDGYPAALRLSQQLGWLNDISDPSCASLVADALQHRLRRGDETHEMTSLFKAVNRCLDRNGPAFYDRLIADPDIPDAAFLWYQRQDCLTALAAATTVDPATVAQHIFTD